MKLVDLLKPTWPKENKRQAPKQTDFSRFQITTVGNNHGFVCVIFAKISWIEPLIITYLIFLYAKNQLKTLDTI